MHTSNSGSARRVRAGLAGLFLLAGIAVLASGCLDRPVVPSTPTTKNLFVDSVKQDSVDKIDLLFMIDNSSSMADKQAILAKAVPELVKRLITPIMVCTDSSGKTTPASGGSCPQGEKGPEQEFKPIKDIHIGVITSSLGGHGQASNVCNPQWANFNPSDNDHGRLLPKVRSGLGDNLGFLAFDGTNGADVEQQFSNQVQVAGEKGCGYESSLEAWYRFLVDPAPPLNVKVSNNASSPDGVDQEVLDERKAFLRPDSLLAIIMLTDEDDCSIRDSGVGWLVAQPSGQNVKPMPRATSACDSDPNSPCCRTCISSESSPPPGCNAISADPACQKGPRLAPADDQPNLRCFEQKRRFGLDLLYPTERYVNALSQLQICPNHADLSCGKDDTPQTNPIFANGRDTSLVFLAGITGVPWQDIATDDTLKTANTLQYKTADQLSKEGVWDTIVGDVNQHVKPSDPLMQESIDPRTGSNPITGDPLAPPSAGVGANPINGHEYDVTDRADLQYACTFPLAAPEPTNTDCSNKASPDKPLCQNPADGSYGTTQYFAKAYPGLRQLQVLKDFGSNSIVASICPKVLDDSNPDYGYNPAVNAIIERLKTALHVQCLPRQLAPDTDKSSSTYGEVPCKVVEALPVNAPNSYSCGNKPGRAPLTGEDGTKLAAAVRSRLKADGQCGAGNEPACSDFNLCEIQQLTNQTGLQSCLNDDPVKAGVNGYCYIDPHQGNPAFISQCLETERRVLRFVPESDTPTQGANVFIACAGATFRTQ